MKTKYSNENTAMLSCSQGCLLGQLAGDALGSLVEFGWSNYLSLSQIIFTKTGGTISIGSMVF